MRVQLFRTAAALMLVAGSALSAGAQPPKTNFADLILGGESVFRLRVPDGGMTAQQRIDLMTERLTPLLGVPNIHPSDVVVYAPSGKSPTIYVLGRRIVTIDPAIRAASSGSSAAAIAAKWAKQLQQTLPRVDWRPSNAPDSVVPKNPSLKTTADFTQVGGMDAPVIWHRKLVLRLRGPQPGSLTAAERADLLTARLDRLVNLPGASMPNSVQVVPPPLPAADVPITLAGAPLIAVTRADAQASGLGTPLALASAWAKNLQAALAPPASTIDSAPPAPPS